MLRINLTPAGMVVCAVCAFVSSTLIYLAWLSGVLLFLVLGALFIAFVGSLTGMEQSYSKNYGDRLAFWARNATISGVALLVVFAVFA
jgi:hypothetical protein